jgi:hypothetical protein
MTMGRYAGDGTMEAKAACVRAAKLPLARAQGGLMDWWLVLFGSSTFVLVVRDASYFRPSPLHRRLSL